MPSPSVRCRFFGSWRAVRILWKLCNIQKPGGYAGSRLESAIQAGGGAQDVGRNVGAGEQGDDMLAERLGLRKDRSSRGGAGGFGDQVLFI